MKCSFLYLRDRWSRWRGRQRWCACVAGAGWGFGHRGSFSRCRLVWRARNAIESEWASRYVMFFWVYFGRFWSTFRRFHNLREALCPMRARRTGWAVGGMFIFDNICSTCWIPARDTTCATLRVKNKHTAPSSIGGANQRTHS